jgi:hypothetical protein
LVGYWTSRREKRYGRKRNGKIMRRKEREETSSFVLNRT